MPDLVRVGVKRLPHADGLPLPGYATPGAAGVDLVAAIPANEPITLAPLGRAAVPSGIAVALPPGFEAQVRPRSGLARNHGVTLLNAPGTVDADYRGEIAAVLINLGTENFTVERGMRIAQLVVAPVSQIAWDERPDLGSTARGDGGFGSTGLGAAAPKA